MKDAVLLELAARWRRVAKPADGQIKNDATDHQSQRDRAYTNGERFAMIDCAEQIEALVELLGESQ